MDDQLLTVSQAASLKAVTRSAIYKAVAEGRLPHQIVLGHTALKEADVLAWTPVGRVKGASRSEAVKAKISAGQKKCWTERNAQS